MSDLWPENTWLPKLERANFGPLPDDDVDFEVKRPYYALTRERRAIQKMKNSDSHIREVAEA
jgi:hypothetical protein